MMEWKGGELFGMRRVASALHLIEGCKRVL